MEPEQAIQAVLRLQIVVSNDGHALALGQKAANQRLTQAAKVILTGLLNRKPTQEEIKQATSY
jgi:hypothetical protein